MTTTTLTRDLLERLGGIPASRVRFNPLPGTATERDVIALDAHDDRLCELVDGGLVEKAMGYRESLLAAAVIAALRSFVVPRKMGFVSGEAGMMRLAGGSVRIPDVAYVSKERLPGGRLPTDPIPELSPDLAVEVLSEGNTSAEMARKRREYFASGCRLVWEIDPDARTVTVYTTADDARILREDETLDGGTVLPGFILPLAPLFAEMDEAL